MDCLEKTDFLSRLGGEVFLTQHMAIEKLIAKQAAPPMQLVGGVI
jgi:hypothetical protein